MLHPNKNRIDFGKALHCPMEGYELDYAIGTSYNLDLESVIFLPIALFFGEDLEITDKASNEMLTALTQVPDKVHLFCQKGKIGAPYYYHQILEFWGENIEQIEMDSYNASFHPKIWLIRYTSKNKPTYFKFICTSRNLTKSTDWDIAITIDGFVGETDIKANQALLDFTKFLDKQAKKKIKKEFLDDISKIKFDLKTEAQLYAFHPIGNGWKNPIFTADDVHEELLVISPFLDAVSTASLTKKANNIAVLSTKYELDKLPENIVSKNVKFYNFNTLLELDPLFADEGSQVSDTSTPHLEEESEFAQATSLHAKLYVTTDKKKNSWYIGSANCTNPAYSNRNIEFLTSITSHDNSLLSTTEVLKILTDTEKNSEGFFLPYHKSEVISDIENEQLEKDFRRTIFDLSKLDISATITANTNELYNYEVNITNPNIYKRENWEIYVQPLSGMKGAKHLITDKKVQHFEFLDFQIHRLTPFFLFTIMETGKPLKQLVVKLDIDFPDNRMKKIFSSLIENWEKLMKYISYLLSKENVEPMIDLVSDPEEKTVNTENHSSWQSQFPIYEKLLKASSRDEHALRQTIQVVDLLKEELDANGNLLVESDFKDLIKTFEEFLPNEPRTTN